MGSWKNFNDDLAKMIRGRSYGLMGRMNPCPCCPSLNCMEFSNTICDTLGVKPFGNKCGNCMAFCGPKSKCFPGCLCCCCVYQLMGCNCWDKCGQPNIKSFET